MSSCCGGNCGCGSDCKCGNGCGGCKMFPDEGITSTQTLVLGFAPVKGSLEGFEVAAGAENDCKCGPNCDCSTCDCHK